MIVLAPRSSYRQDMHMAHRFLAPALGNCGADGTTKCLCYRIWIAPEASRQGLEGLHERIVYNLVHGAALAVALRDADQIKRRTLGHVTPVGDRKRYGYRTGKTEPPALGDGAGVRFHQKRAVLVDATSRHFVNYAHVRRELHEVAIAAPNDIAHPAASRERGVLMEVKRLAVNGDNDLRFHPANQIFKLGTPWMARDVEQMGRYRDHYDTLLDQHIAHAPDGLFVSGNISGRIDHPVACRKRHFWVLFFGNARKCGPRLSLASGAQRDDLFRRQIAIGIDGTKILHALAISGFARNLHNALHCASNHQLLPVAGPV